MNRQQAVYQAAECYGINEPYLSYLEVGYCYQRRLRYDEIVLICRIMDLARLILDGHTPMGD